MKQHLKPKRYSSYSLPFKHGRSFKFLSKFGLLALLEYGFPVPSLPIPLALLQAKVGEGKLTRGSLGCRCKQLTKYPEQNSRRLSRCSQLLKTGNPPRQPHYLLRWKNLSDRFKKYYMYFYACLKLHNMTPRVKIFHQVKKNSFFLRGACWSLSYFRTIINFCVFTQSNQ